MKALDICSLRNTANLVLIFLICKFIWKHSRPLAFTFACKRWYSLFVSSYESTRINPLLRNKHFQLMFLICKFIWKHVGWAFSYCIMSSGWYSLFVSSYESTNPHQRLRRPLCCWYSLFVSSYESTQNYFCHIRYD